MTQTSVFILGVVVSIICSAGLIFSIVEMRRLAAETDRDASRRQERSPRA